MSTDAQLFSHIVDLEYKFDSSLMTLAFSALALSIQFSPKMGHDLSWLLIVAHRVFEWVILTVLQFRQHAREYLQAQVLLVA